MESIGNACSIASSFFGSFYSFLWSMVTQLGFWKCLLILLGLIFWVCWEIFSKGTHKYNSENGLTPGFNRFIGATTYFWIQAVINLVLEYFFTSAVYCFKWPYGLHLGTFLLTGLFLHLIGIWSYWRLFGMKIRLR